MKAEIFAVAVGVAVLVGFLVYALTTRAPIREAPSPVEPAPFDPFAADMLVHMQEAEALRVGSGPEDDLAVVREGSQIRVIVAEHLLERLGPGALGKLGMFEHEELMSRSRYSRFLEDLHDLLVAAMPHAHEHDHNHVGPEKDHVHDAEGR